MPMASQIGGAAWYHHYMADTRFDPRVAPGTHVCLAVLIRLHRMHGGIVEHHPKNPHATTASVNAMNTTTSTMSVVERF